MNKLLDWLYDHPRVLGIVIAGAVGCVAWDTFEVGRNVGRLDYLHGDADRAASEALGG